MYRCIRTCYLFLFCSIKMKLPYIFACLFRTQISSVCVKFGYCRYERRGKFWYVGLSFFTNAGEVVHTQARCTQSGKLRRQTSLVFSIALSLYYFIGEDEENIFFANSALCLHAQYSQGQLPRRQNEIEVALQLCSSRMNGIGCLDKQKGILWDTNKTYMYICTTHVCIILEQETLSQFCNKHLLKEDF